MSSFFEYLKALARSIEKVIAFSSKEIQLIRSQNIAIALIFLYPVLAIASLAFALSGVSVIDISFGETGLENVAMGLVLPEESLFFDSNSFRGELSSFQYLDIVEYSTKDNLVGGIKKGEVVVGAVVQAPEFKKDFIKAQFLYDDSSLFASGTILTQAQTAINAIGFKKSSEILTSLLENLNEITSNISDQAGKTDEIIGQLESTNRELLDLNESIHSIDTNQILSKLSLFDEYYEQSKQDINTTLSDINGMKVSLEGYRQDAAGVRGRIDDVLLPFEEDLNGLYGAAEISDEPLKSLLFGIHSTLSSSLQDVKEASVGINEIIKDIDDTRQKLDAAEEKLLLADSRLDLAKAEIEEFSGDFTKIGSLIGQSKELVSSTYESKVFVLGELKNAKYTFTGLINTLEGLKEFSPEYIVNPIKLGIEPVYGITKVSAMVPVSMALILLLTTLLLASSSVIIEREKGIYFRLKSSPTKHSSWLAGKMLGQMVFALIEAAIILVIAFFAFGVPIPPNITDFVIALALVSFSFICIGLFIPEIMKTQATAILSSLLVLIPMLFLSGMVFPIEFMPQPIDAIASVLPLTAATNILSGIMTRGLPLAALLSDFAVLLTPSLLLLGITLWKNRG